MNGQKPFEGDSFIGAEIMKLRDKFSLVNCIETGTQYGATTKALNDIFKYVLTVEADEKLVDDLKKSLPEEVVVVVGKSQEILKEIESDDVLYYLDAHGCDIGGSPLKEELESIASHNYKNVVIAIHDFKVPFRDFGYDTYDFEYTHKEIKDYLKKIYPDGYHYHYNDKADGAKRGIIYIYPPQ